MVRPVNQALQILFRHAANMHHRDPMKAAHIARRFEAGNVGEFKKCAGWCAKAEAPHFRIAGFEIRKRLAANVVVQEIAGRAIQARFSARHLAAIGFNKANVHVFNNIMP